MAELEKELVSLLEGLGSLKLESLSTWFIDEELINIKNVIEHSKELFIEDEFVCFRRNNYHTDVKIEEKKPVELTFEEIVDIIDKYNEKVMAKFSKLNPELFNNKVKSILSFYENKYCLLKERNDNLRHVYSMINKKKNVDSGFLIIVENLDENISKMIERDFEDERVIIAVIGELEYKIDNDLNDFTVKEVTKIIDSYSNKYRLKKIEQLLYNIEKEEK